MTKQLQNPPLIEALLEIKWDLEKKRPDTFEDPGYKLASGRLFDKVKKKFGYIQNLPITIIPEELTPYAVRTQFRAEENGWPLVQLGPGVATVNVTPPYTWRKFKDSIRFFIPHLFGSYSGIVPGQPDYQLVLNSTMLRYINGIEWDWAQGNTLDFLRDNLHTNFQLPEQIIARNPGAIPENINLQIGYPVNLPRGQVILRFATGTVGQARGLVLELIFHSVGANSPQLNDVEIFSKWLTDAHTELEACFFSLIEGGQFRKFMGDDK